MNENLAIVYPMTYSRDRRKILPNGFVILGLHQVGSIEVFTAAFRKASHRTYHLLGPRFGGVE